ncbi:MAG: hypothetical protein JWR26_5031 [Pedosphaera sp.]|nr:hypothetical protein [Pedosphaera sp.]
MRSSHFNLIISGRKDGAVMFVAARHGPHVIFGAREGDLIEEDGAVGCGGAVPPFEDIAATGIVIGQRIHDGVVRCCVALQKFIQVPGADEGVGAGIQQMPGRERQEMLGDGPIPRGGLGQDLHEADLAFAATGGGVEMAFTPDHSLDEGGFHAITLRGGEDRDVLAALTPLRVPPISAQPCSEEEQQHKQVDVVARFHRVFLQDGGEKEKPERGNSYVQDGGVGVLLLTDCS